MKEERKHLRVMVNWPIGILQADKSVVRGKVVNISLGGMGLISPLPMDLGRQYKVAVDMSEPDNQALRTRIVFTVKALHCIMIADGFRVGVEYAEKPQMLLEKWKNELTGLA